MEKKGLGKRLLLMSMLSLISLFGMSISTFAEEDEFQKMEERWKSQLVFEKESPENESLRAYIEALSKEAENYIKHWINHLTGPIYGHLNREILLQQI